MAISSDKHKLLIIMNTCKTAFFIPILVFLVGCNTNSSSPIQDSPRETKSHRSISQNICCCRGCRDRTGELTVDDSGNRTT
jgi:hypothetical protein